MRDFYREAMNDLTARVLAAGEPEATTARYKQYDVLTNGRWSDPRSYAYARARVNRDQHVQFGLDHDQQTARPLQIFLAIGVPPMPPYEGVHAEVEPFRENHGTDLTHVVGLHLRLMGYPFNGQTVYRIIK